MKILGTTEKWDTKDAFKKKNPYWIIREISKRDITGITKEGASVGRPQYCHPERSHPEERKVISPSR